MTYSPLRFLPQVFVKNKPIHLVFFVTKICNARCPFCFYLEDNNLSLENGDMSLEEIQKFSSSLGNMLWIAFSGGEVFLRKDLPDIARTFYRNNKPSIMFFPTNGLLPERIAGMSEEIAKTCPETAITVKISLDAIGDLHDEMRGTKGCFAKLCKTYEALAPLIDKYPNFDLGINTVYTEKNQTMMDEVIDFVRKWPKVTTHTISLTRGDLKNPEWKNVDLAGYRRAVDRLEKEVVEGKHPIYRFWGGRIKAGQDILQRQVIHKTAEEGKWQIPCYAGKLNVTVTHDGLLYPCEVFTDDFKLWDMRKQGYDIREALRSPRAKEVTDRIKAGCFCTHECYTMTNLLFNPKKGATILKNALRIKRGGPAPAR